MRQGQNGCRLFKQVLKSSPASSNGEMELRAQRFAVCDTVNFQEECCLKFCPAIGAAVSFIPALLTAQSPLRDLTPEPIRVQKKLALVIGNQSYPKSPLRNPVNDAVAMAKALREMGFDTVVEKKDLTMRQMRVEIDRFAASLQAGDLALFYYAGHGVQANDQNYLIPVDFGSVSEADLPYDAYPASQARDKLEQSGARLRILILDACRNNPFRSKRDGVRGLSPMASSVEGTFIAYATADNGVADDNPNDSNGLFTKSLLNAMLTSGLDLKQIFEKAKEEVYAKSQKRQRPYTYDGVIGQFFFGPVTIVNQPVVSSSDITAEEEIAYWNGVDKSDRESLELYLKRYPNGRYADLARRNLVKMATSTAVPAAPTLSRAGEARLNPRDGLQYVWIPAGSFEMGCSPHDSECTPDESPGHLVRLTKGFWMGQTEVTVEAWSRFAKATMHEMPPEPREGGYVYNPGWSFRRLPMDNISWSDSKSYCTWVGGRLPTEAQWEYAARAGNTESRYGPVDEIAWYTYNSGDQPIDFNTVPGRQYQARIEQNHNRPHDVATKKPNAWGLYDMLGNVNEWVSDRSSDRNSTRYQESPEVDPQGSATGTLHIFRGGNYYRAEGAARASQRGIGFDGSPGGRTGCRCVLDEMPGASKSDQLQ